MKLEELVRPGALELAREAVRRGIDVEGMCLQPTYNQRCYSCGKHHGWACVCKGEEKKEARREAKMQTPWFAGKWATGNILDGYATQDATHDATRSQIGGVQHTEGATHLCNTCRRPITGRGKVCSTCRSKAYRGR